MAHPFKTGLAGGSLLAAMILGGCVWQSDYDALAQKNKDLQSQIASQQADLTAKDQQIARLQGAIKYTVNSDLLFPPGSWKMSDSGKRVIANMAAKLAPTQQNKLYVSGYTDNTPIGPELMKQGITSNEMLSQRRAEDVMQFLISQGVKPELVAAEGFGDSNPVAPNDTAAGRAKNRRVELTLTPL
jgi:chemotaxis protein MotB